MNKDQNSYAKQKANESLPAFFKDITREIISDSPSVYGNIKLFCGIVLAIFLAASLKYQVKLSSIHLVLIDGLSGVYLLLPPFVLAIIAMFPAFSERTKEALAVKLEDGKAFGAIFLNEFVFLTFWSLVVIGHSIFTKVSYSLLSETSTLEGCFVSVNFSISLFIILAVAYEIFHSIKIMYLLVLKEYY